MDSMRHLSTSLPTKRGESSDILSDFRAAALSVTTLYKNAAKAQESSRAVGYQDALDDLLSFLDKENLGLMDGEGWKVRQWATTRLEEDGATPRQGGTSEGMADDEDDNSTSKDEDKEDERSSSPEAEKKRPTQGLSATGDQAGESLQHRRVVSEPPPQQPIPTQSAFTFESAHQYPKNHDREGNNGMELDGGTTPQYQAPMSSNPSSAETVRIVRSSKRDRRNNRRNETRLPTINFNLGSGAGSKRKLPYQEFFDITGFNNINNNNDGQDRKDGGGRGGKRGRFV